MEVESVATLRVATVRWWSELAHRRSINRPAMHAQPLTDRGESRSRARIEFAARGWADIQQEIAAFRNAVDQELDEHFGRLPIEVVAVVAPAAIQGLARLPDHG